MSRAEWLVALLSKFPSFDPEWDPEVQEKWFHAYGHLHNLLDAEREAQDRVAAP